MTTSTSKTSVGRGRDRLTTSIETITPAKARRILERNENRKLVPSRVQKFKRILVNGDWYTSPDSIHIDRDGVLRNAQHRLTAVAESGVSAQFQVLRGGGEEIQKITDDGARRSAADVLTLGGVPNASVVAAATRLLHRYINSGDPRPDSGGRQGGIPNFEIDALRAEHPGIDNSAYFARSLRRKGVKDILPTSVVAGLHYLMASGHAEEANEFFSGLATGVELAEGSPILTLRNKLISQRDEPGVRQLNLKIVIPWVVRSWNAYIRGERLTKLMTLTQTPPIDGCVIKVQRGS